MQCGTLWAGRLALGLVPICFYSITLCLPRLQPTSELNRNRKDGFRLPPTVHRDVSTGQSDQHYCNHTIIIITLFAFQYTQ